MRNPLPLACSNRDGTVDPPSEQVLWVIAWQKAGEEVTRTSCYSFHLTPGTAEQFVRWQAPEGYTSLGWNISYVGYIGFIDGTERQEEPAPLVIKYLGGGGECDYNLMGVAALYSTNTAIFTHLKFEEAQRHGGFVVTTEVDDPLRHLAINMRETLREIGFFSYGERPKVTPFGARPLKTLEGQT